MEDGSRAIARIGLILKALEAGPPEGMSIADIAGSLNEDRTTIRRAVVGLEKIGLIDRDPLETSYRLGTYLFSLGAKTARRFDALSHAREAIRRLAEVTGDTVVLCVRNKFDVVCIDRRSGSYPIKAQTLSIGESLPIGVSSAGLAILAAMSDEEVRHVIQYNAVRIDSFHRVRPNDLYSHVDETRKRGYSCYRGHIVAGMGALGFAIRNAQKEALAAISISAVVDRLTDTRMHTLVDAFAAEVEAIERKSALMSPAEFRQD